MTLNFPKAKLVTLAPGLRPERRLAPLARGLGATVLRPASPPPRFLHLMFCNQRNEN